MKIQLALDMFELEEAVEAAEKLKELVQIIEVGTPLVLKEGRNGIKRIREAFPKHEILADYKIMDAGALEASVAFEAGADIVTVCGAANTATIKGAVEKAAEYGKKIMIDMIEVSDFKTRVKELDCLGAEYLQVHTAFDGRAGKTPIAELICAKKNIKNSQIAVAGGIGLDTISVIMQQTPNLIVVGSGVFNAENPYQTLKQIINKTGV